VQEDEGDVSEGKKEGDRTEEGYGEEATGSGSR
jgi:hypothetical protein